jgi:hypothetical protein
MKSPNHAGPVDAPTRVSLRWLRQGGAPMSSGVRRERKCMEKAEPRPSVLIDLLIVAIAIGLLAAACKFGLETGHPATRGTAAIIGGAYIIYFGLLFTLNYFFPRRSFLFGFLDYVCRESSRPAGRAMAWFYFRLGIFFGSGLLLLYETAEHHRSEGGRTQFADSYIAGRPHRSVFTMTIRQPKGI